MEGVMWMGGPAWAPTGARAMPDRARHLSTVNDLTGGMRDMAGFLPPCLDGWSRKATPQFTTRAPAARFGTLPRSSTTTIIASGSEEPTDRDGRHAAVTNRPRTGPTKVHRTLCTASRPGEETVMTERRISR